jgi:hypothetical protein
MLMASALCQQNYAESKQKNISKSQNHRNATEIYHGFVSFSYVAPLLPPHPGL